LSGVNTVGLVICLVGVALHILWKFYRVESNEMKNVKANADDEELASMLTSDDTEITESSR